MQAAAGSRRSFWAYVLLLLIQRFMVTITFYSIISSLFLQARGLDYTLIFSLESWLAVSLLLLEVPSGIWADRFDRKRTLFVGMLLHVAATYVFAFAHSYGLFVLSFLLSGLGMAILSGTDGTSGHNPVHPGNDGHASYCSPQPGHRLPGRPVAHDCAALLWDHDPGADLCLLAGNASCSAPQ